jgi:aldehyde dehydrogenase (NAD+)
MPEIRQLSEASAGEITFPSLAGCLAAGKRVRVSGQFIAGGWRVSTRGSSFDVISPATEEPVATLRAASDTDVDEAVSAARSALRSGSWAGISLDERIAVVEGVCAKLEAQADHIARVQTEQMGAPITATRASVARRVAANMRSNVNAARQLPTRFLVPDDEGVTLVERRPVGVVGVIVPWNAPLSFEADKVSAALLSGCSAVLKAAPEAPLEAFALAGLFSESGLPPGVLNVVAGAGDVGEMIVSHPGVARVTFTGSTATGKRIAAICSGRLAKATLELGGKSAALILPDADLDPTAAVIASSNFGNAGQSCHALTRVLIPRGLQTEFLDRVRAIAQALVIGDPRQPETQLGPLVSERQRSRVEGKLALARHAGATAAVGGGRPRHMDKGWYVEPTVLTDVANSMEIAREEIFGPVMSVLTYGTVDEAIAIANDSEYGLGGSVFTTDPDHGLEVARRIDAGMLAVNAWGMTRSAPFGGVKDSGIGREHGIWGLASCFETYAIRPDPRSAADRLLAASDGIEAPVLAD